MKKTIISFIMVFFIIVLFTQTALAAKKIDHTYIYTQAEINEVIRVVYAECKNQPYLGMIGVAHTVFSRYENNKGKYSMKHITRRSQYAKAGAWIFRSKKKSVITIVEKCHKAVLYAMNNRIFPSNCTMFQRANRSHWGRSKNIPRYCRIGAHTFYTVGKDKPVNGLEYVDKNGKLIRRDLECSA